MGRTIALVVALLFWTAPAAADPLRGRVTDPSPLSTYELQIFTSLDLTHPGQPVARAPVDIVTGEFSLEYDHRGGPFWAFVFQRFQPETGPGFDLYLPADLMPLYSVPTEPVEVPGVDPAPMMSGQDRFAVEGDVLARWLVLVLGLFGAGFTVRRLLKGQAAPEGARCAPLADSALPPRASRRELIALLVIIAVAAALRLKGMFSESLDLLELSYTPGIGRPSPPPTSPAQLVREVGHLYCLDLTHPPGYHLVTGVMGLFGRGDWLLRVPGLLSSLATCALIWRLFRRWSTPAGLLSAGVFAVCAPGIYFGQDATPYAAVGMLSILSVLVLIHALETGRDRAWTAWFGVLVLGFFFHYTMALLGVGMLGVLLGVGWLRRADRRWGAAIHRAMRPAILWAPLPLAWCWLHFSTHPSNSEFTRLFTDAYIQGPGLLSWVWDFWSVTAGLQVDTTQWAVIAVTPLFGLGLWRAARPKGPGAPPAELGLLLAAMTVTFLFSVRFFYVGQMSVLAGHVLYAFRWVGWFLPLVIGLCVVGALHGPGDKLGRATLAALWLVGVGLATQVQITEVSRPDYAGAARFIRAEMEDRDGVATLPAWFQRGNLAWYLMGDNKITRLPDEGEGVWLLDGKRITVEAIHQGLPFETTARNVHFDRLWLAVVDETMYGREKFRGSVAEQGVAWADVHLVPDGVWDFDRIRLHRYKRRPGDGVLSPGDPLRLSSAQVVMTHRTYPPLDTADEFVPGTDLAAPQPLGRTLLHHAPMSPGCVDWVFAGLKPELKPAAPNHWYIKARIPLAPGAAIPQARALGPAQVSLDLDGTVVVVTAVGGPCDEAPLEVVVE